MLQLCTEHNSLRNQKQKFDLVFALLAKEFVILELDGVKLHTLHYSQDSSRFSLFFQLNNFLICVKYSNRLLIIKF
jgi:hypothetical protein